MAKADTIPSSSSTDPAVMKMPLKRIFPYLVPLKGRFIMAILIGVAAAAFNVVILQSFEIIFSLVLRGKTDNMGKNFDFFGVNLNPANLLGVPDDTAVSFKVAIIACACIPILFLIRGLLEYLNKYCLAWVGNKMLYAIRNDTFASILRQSPAFFSGTKAGELIQTVFNQTGVAQRNAVQLVQLVTSSPLKVIAILSLLFWKYPFFTFMSLFVFPLCVLPVVRLSKRVKKSGRLEEQQAGAMLTAMHESFGGIRLVKAYSRESYEVARFERANNAMSRNAIRWQRASEMAGPIVESVASLGISVGLLYWWKMEFEAGAFMLVILSLTQLYPPAKELSKVNLLLQKTAYAVNNVVALLDREPDIKDVPDAVVLNRIKGEVSMEDVTFTYRNQEGQPLDQPAVREVSLKLDPGKFYAFVGPSGAGKSTLFSLLLRFYEPDSGRIMIDGIDLRKVTQQSLRENIGIVSQDTFLFHDTIRENIRYGRLDATEAEIVAAAKKSHAHDFIMAQNKGYDTVVGDAGCNLSGGQKQRLSIARAVLRNAPILLLDEATSALDTETERIIQDAIHQLSEGKTVIAIAHRLSTIMEADQIVVMRDGRVQAVGTHAQLLATSELYQNLNALQFKET
jgi:ATP-binding cassette, subfamily B, bacterial MsbA